MDKQTETYREEAYELLAELEASLLELEETPDDTGMIGRIFRALHTIKGSGAMFGFDDIAEFTHELETIFDLVRGGKISVTKELIDLTLSARDQIKAMLDASEGGETADTSISEEIIIAIRAFLPDTEKDLEEQESEIRKLKPEARYLKPGNITYRIRFHPDPDIFINGTNPIFLLNELQEFGEARIVAQTNAVPRLEDIEPEKCYIYWDIILTTSEGIDAIENVFVFVEDDCEIHIEIIDEAGGPENETGYKRLGEILVERGDISTRELLAVLEEQRRLGELLVAAEVVEQGAVDSALAEQEHIRTVRKTRKESTSSSSIRVPSERLDSLVDLVGELVTVQARLSQKASFQSDPELLSIAEEVQRLTANLRDNTMRIRMLPIGATFARFKRLVRDLSNELGKEAIMIIEGADTELDKTVIEQLNDPLVHIIRNTIDHGIESPDFRESEGKPRQGTIRLSAEHSGPNVLIRVFDDGAGIDPEVIRAKAVEKGLIVQDADLDEKEILSLIFAPGFSTAKKISGISGRGVGLDVVKRTVEALRGTVKITSKKGKGTTTTLKLPLTLAIIDGLLVKIGEACFILPLSVVEECVELIHDDLTWARRRSMMNFRGKIIPYLDLREAFMVEGDLPPVKLVVVAEAMSGRIGFGVDHVIGQYQTVIKTIGKFYKDAEGISGATILGDGTVALILDTAQLVQSVENEAMFSV